MADQARKVQGSQALLPGEQYPHRMGQYLPVNPRSQVPHIPRPYPFYVEPLGELADDGLYLPPYPFHSGEDTGMPRLAHIRFDGGLQCYSVSRKPFLRPYVALVAEEGALDLPAKIHGRLPLVGIGGAQGNARHGTVHGYQQVPLEPVVCLCLRGTIAVPCLTLEQSGKVCPPETAYGYREAVDDVDAVVQSPKLQGQMFLEQNFYRPQVGTLADERAPVADAGEKVGPMVPEVAVYILVFVHAEKLPGYLHGEDLVVAQAGLRPPAAQRVWKFLEIVAYETKDIDDKLFPRHGFLLG